MKHIARSAPIILALTVCGLFDAARAQDFPPRSTSSGRQILIWDPTSSVTVSEAPRSRWIFPIRTCWNTASRRCTRGGLRLPPATSRRFPLTVCALFLDPIGKAHAKLAQSGTLRLVAIVGKDGQVIEARILESPSEQLGQFAARLPHGDQVQAGAVFRPAVPHGVPA